MVELFVNIFDIVLKKLQKPLFPLRTLHFIYISIAAQKIFYFSSPPTARTGRDVFLQV